MNREERGVKVRKTLGWSSAVILALLVARESKGRPEPLFLRAVSLPKQKLGPARGGKRLVSVMKVKGWQTYRFERFADEALRVALRLGLIDVAPNEHAAPRLLPIPDKGFSWGKRAGIRISLTELGRASFSAYLLRGGEMPYAERFE